MAGSQGPLGERVRALETEVATLKTEAERNLDIITKANSSHHGTVVELVKSFSNHITAETNRWLKAFYWIAFALMTVGGVTVGNTKFTEKIIEALFK